MATARGLRLPRPGFWELLGGLVLASLALLVPKLPRPTRRAVATLPRIRVAPPEWSPWIPLAPPSRSLLSFA